MTSTRTIRLATRGSRLALWQANRVADLIRRCDPAVACELVVVSTRPDRDQNRSLEELGGDKGLFVREVEQAILDGRADAAVHSLKDVPVEDAIPGLELVAFPERQDPRDVLVSRDNVDLPHMPAGSLIATGSPRRQAQLLAMRPDVRVCGVRGNVETRLEKLRRGDFHAIIMASAGLKRLDLDHAITREFAMDEITPAPGQGTLVVQSRAGSEYADLWAQIDDPATRAQAQAERHFSHLLGATCYTAAGCNVEITPQAVRIHAVVCSADGTVCLRYFHESTDFHPDQIDGAVADLTARGARDYLNG